MTQEQLEQIEAWRESLDEKQNDEHIVNAMWLAEEMWERHHSILRSTDNRDFGTYMMAFCMALMEYIWMPHDIIKAITADLDDTDTMPEEFICIYREYRGNYLVRMSYIACNEETGHDYEKRETIKVCDTKTEAEALTAILNHANQAGHDAVTRLSA
jgi:hypothetical protein